MAEALRGTSLTARSARAARTLPDPRVPGIQFRNGRK